MERNRKSELYGSMFIDYDHVFVYCTGKSDWKCHQKIRWQRCTVVCSGNAAFVAGSYAAPLSVHVGCYKEFHNTSSQRCRCSRSEHHENIFKYTLLYRALLGVIYVIYRIVLVIYAKSVCSLSSKRLSLKAARHPSCICNLFYRIDVTAQSRNCKKMPINLSSLFLGGRDSWKLYKPTVKFNCDSNV